MPQIQKLRQRATTNANCTPKILRLMDEKASTASMLLCKGQADPHTATSTDEHTHTQTSASAQRKCRSFGERTKVKSVGEGEMPMEMCRKYEVIWIWIQNFLITFQLKQSNNTDTRTHREQYETAAMSKKDENERNHPRTRRDNVRSYSFPV